MTTNAKQPGMKTPITYYGGKQQLSKKIISLIPDHTQYIEPFCGGGAIFFAKPPSQVEVLNDTNRELINFFRVVQNDFVSLQKEINISLYSRLLHKQAKVVYENPEMFSEMKRAWAVFILSNQSFGAILDNSWGYGVKTNQASKKFKNRIADLTEEYAIRLQNVYVENRDALQVIQAFDTEDSFIYADPPYINSACGHYDGYSEQDFENLLTTLTQVKGKFLLSSYPGQLLDRFTKENGWYQISVEMSLSMSKKGKKKNEILTANYPIQ